MIALALIVFVAGPLIGAYIADFDARRSAR